MSDEARPSGRDAVVHAAVRLLASADLTQILGFLSYRSVAREAHVRPGTVEYHVASKRELDLAAVRTAVSWYRRLDHAPILAALAALDDGTGDLEGLAAAMGQELEATGPTGVRDPELAAAGMAVVLLTAAARNDEEAAAIMRSAQTQAVSEFADLHAATVAATGRAWREQWDAPRLGRLTQALVTGILYLRRYDTADGSVELFTDAWMRLFLAVTEDVGDVDVDTVDRVAARFGASTDSDDELRELLVTTARQVHAEQGWRGLTLHAVAARSGVSRVDAVRLIGDRRELAAAVWGAKLARLERALGRLEDVDSLERVVRVFLEEIVDAAREDMALTAAFLEGLWAGTARAAEGAGGGDPHLLARITGLLTPCIERRAGQLSGDLDLEAADLAAMLVGYALYMSYSRPAWPTERVVEVIMSSTYRGLAQPTTP